MLRGSVINKFSQLSPGSFIHSVGISNETSFSYPQTIHAEAEEGHRRAFAASLLISIHDCFAYLLCLWYNKQKAGILRRKLYESTGIIISIAR